MKTYLFAYSQVCTQAQVHAFLNDTNAIKTWIAPFPYAAIQKWTPGIGQCGK